MLSPDMPIFEYVCRRCGEKFEKFTQRRDDPEPATCPRCGQTPVERVFSTFAVTGAGASPCACEPAGRFT